MQTTSLLEGKDQFLIIRKLFVLLFTTSLQLGFPPFQLGPQIQRFLLASRDQGRQARSLIRGEERKRCRAPDSS